MVPSAFDRVDVLRAARDAAGSLLIGLDFDGTLAPIVPHPGQAALPDDTREAIAALTRREDTHVAFVSGRSLADLRARAAFDDVYYAGNHGLEIEGPGVHRIHPEAEAARDTLARLARALEQSPGSMEGVIIEDKVLTLSVHFRLVDGETRTEQVRQQVRDTARGFDGIRLTDGKKVVEIRPDVDWNKGRAFGFLRDTLEQQFGRGPAIFIGDDRTDEDAFRELGEPDCSIVVGDPPQHESIAHTQLRSPHDVAEFLRRLAAGGT